MADFGNQLEDAAGGLERLSEGFDNLMIRITSASTLEAQIAKEKQSVNKQLAKVNRDKLREEKRALPIQKKVTVQLQQRLKNTTLLNKGLKETVKGMKLFEKGMSGMSKGLGAGGKAIAAVGKAGAIGGLVAGIKFLVDGLFMADNYAAKLSKTLKATRTDIAPLQAAAADARKQLEDMSPAGDAFGVTLAQLEIESANMAQHFGRIKDVTGDLITQSIILQKSYGLSAEASGQLLESLTRANVEASKFVQTVGNDAREALTIPSLVMRDLASQSKQIAIQSERGLESMKYMAVEAARAGGSMSDMAGVKGAFSNIETIGERVGRVASFFGNSVHDAMGGVHEMYMMYQRGDIKGLHKKTLAAMQATLKINEEGRIVNQDNRELYESEKEAWSEMSGVAFEMLGRQFKLNNLSEDELKILKKQTEEKAAQIEQMDLQRGLLEMLGDIGTTVYENLALAFSKALGGGGARETVTEFSKWLTEMMSFDTLEHDVEQGGGGLVGFFKAMLIRIKPIIDELMKTLVSSITSALDDYDWSWYNMKFTKKAESQAAQETASDFASAVGAKDTPFGPMGGQVAATTSSTRVQKITKLTPEQQTAAAASLLAKGIDPSTTGLFPPEALGGIGGRRTALVGEAGGEVVISRSALRSGVGVSGQAASALSSIGVPGYYRGAAVRSAQNRQGLMGGFGSEALRSAQSSAFQDEQARQQAAMIEYWRTHYEEKMDDMVDEKVKKEKEGPPWLARMFLKYNKQIATELNKRAGPTMTAAIMVGMEKWSKGGSLSEAMSVGAKAGILQGLNDPNSKLNELVERTGYMADTVRAGLAAFAGGASKEKIKRTLISGAITSVAKKYLGQEAFDQASQYMLPGAATGKYVNSPTLMMVGEEGRGEVVVPTERIRKGLPINAGVARELGSIGVPGFSNGGSPSAYRRFQKTSSVARGYAGGKYDQDKFWTNTLAQQRSDAMSGLSFGGKAGFRFEEMGGFGGMAKAGGAGAALSFADTYMRTGSWKRGATAGVGSAAGVGIGMGLSALGVPPPLSTFAGQMIGGFVTKGLDKVFGLTGGQKKGRRRSVKILENFVKSRGMFDFGRPQGTERYMNLAIGGKEKTPTEANYNKLVRKIGGSRALKPLWRAGVSPEVLIGLGTGQMTGRSAMDAYSAMNTALYGAGGGDAYMKTLAMPQLARGGIVTKPTTAVIGESGPEMVIPLNEQRLTNDAMITELKKQNTLMMEMIKTQKETGGTEIRLDGRKISETVGQNFYDMGNNI